MRVTMTMSADGLEVLEAHRLICGLLDINTKTPPKSRLKNYSRSKRTISIEDKNHSVLSSGQSSDHLISDERLKGVYCKASRHTTWTQKGRTWRTQNSNVYHISASKNKETNSPHATLCNGSSSTNTTYSCLCDYCLLYSSCESMADEGEIVEEDTLTDETNCILINQNSSNDDVILNERDNEEENKYVSKKKVG